MTINPRQMSAFEGETEPWPAVIEWTQFRLLENYVSCLQCHGLFRIPQPGEHWRSGVSNYSVGVVRRSPGWGDLWFGLVEYRNREGVLIKTVALPMRGIHRCGNWRREVKR